MCGGGLGEYKSSGGLLLSQIISEQLVIVAQRGSKITLQPTLHAANSLGDVPNVPSAGQEKIRPTGYCYMTSSQKGAEN